MQLHVNPCYVSPIIYSTRVEKVLKELSTKRVGFDKAAFVKTAGELLPVLCQAWDAQWVLVEGLLAPVAAGDDMAPTADSEAAGAVALAAVCIKVRVLWVRSADVYVT